MPTITTDIQSCAAALRAGRLVAMPTETVYGLAAPIHDTRAVRRIFEIKQRPLFDPLIVHIADIDQANEVVRDWPAAAARLAERFWPGPLTLVLPKRADIDPLITAGLDTVGVRMPRHDAARALIRAAGTPLAAPSANRFGRTSPTTARHVAQEFEGEDLLILDGGPCDVGLESTVAGIDETPGAIRVTVFRPGFVTQSQIAAALAGAKKSVEVVREAGASSPGQSKTHYQPPIPLVVVDLRPQKNHDSAPLAPDVRAFRALDRPSARAQGAELHLDPNPVIAARTLYSEMRRLASSGAGFMFVRRLPAHIGDQWDAIWDRLARAATAHAH